MNKFLCQNCSIFIDSDNIEKYHCKDSCPSCGGRTCGCDLCLSEIENERIVIGYSDYDGKLIDYHVPYLCHDCGRVALRGYFEIYNKPVGVCDLCSGHMCNCPACKSAVDANLDSIGFVPKDCICNIGESDEDCLGTTFPGA